MFGTKITPFILLFSLFLFANYNKQECNTIHPIHLYFPFTLTNLNHCHLTLIFALSGSIFINFVPISLTTLLNLWYDHKISSLKTTTFVYTKLDLNSFLTICWRSHPHPISFTFLCEFVLFSMIFSLNCYFVLWVLVNHASLHVVSFNVYFSCYQISFFIVWCLENLVTLLLIWIFLFIFIFVFV